MTNPNHTTPQGTPAPLALHKAQLLRLEQMAATMPWQKLEILLTRASKNIGEPFEQPVLLMKLLVLQELLKVDMPLLRSHLGKHYSLFIYLIPGMEGGLPERQEIDRLKTCLKNMNLLYPFLNECADILGLNRARLDLSAYCQTDNPHSIRASSLFAASQELASLACPRCGRKHTRIRKQNLMERWLNRKRAYICNACAYHFELEYTPS